MPLYEYTHNLPSECQDPFEVIQTLNEPPLNKCPKCGSACKRMVSSPNIPGRKKTEVREKAKSLGFKAFKRKGYGKYEQC